MAFPHVYVAASAPAQAGATEGHSNSYVARRGVVQCDCNWTMAPTSWFALQKAERFYEGIADIFEAHTP
jgi:hypothetical protein